TDEEMAPDLKVESNVKLDKDSNGVVQAVYFWRKEIGEERGIWETVKHILVQYNSSKRVESILVWNNSGAIEVKSEKELPARLAEEPKDDGIAKPAGLLLVIPSYDSHGKIEAVVAKA